MDLIWKILGWVTTMFLGAVSWLVYVVRQNDKLNMFADQQKKLSNEFEGLREQMQRLSFEVEKQQENINKIVDTVSKLNEAIHTLNIHTEVIASWVKQQTGDTLIKQRKH